MRGMRLPILGEAHLASHSRVRPSGSSALHRTGRGSRCRGDPPLLLIVVGSRPGVGVHPPYPRSMRVWTFSSFQIPWTKSVTGRILCLDPILWMKGIRLEDHRRSKVQGAVLGAP